MSKESLWTVITIAETGRYVADYWQSEPLCGGKEPCGYCRDCVLTQLDGNEQYHAIINVPYGTMVQMRELGEKS